MTSEGADLPGIALSSAGQIAAAPTAATAAPRALMQRLTRLVALSATALALGVIGSALRPAPALGLDPVGSSLYVDLDPQGGGYAIHLPDDGDWHTRSTSDSATITGYALGLADDGEGFTVSDGRWAVSFFNKSGPVTTGTFDVPTPGDHACGDICAWVAAGPPPSYGDCYGSGPFTIHDVAFDEAGELVRADADFRLLCGDRLVMSGSVRFRSDRDTIALDQSADRVFFPVTTIGETAPSRTVTVTNFGSVATQLGTLVLGGTEGDDFAAADDGCSGTTLAVGDSCSVVLTFTPTAVGNRFADLTIPDETSRGARAFRIVGYGQQQSVLTFEATSLPAFGPGPATFTFTVTPPSPEQAPVLFIDGAQEFAPSRATHADPSRGTFTYEVTVRPGHHVATAELRQGGWYLGATAPPIEFDVGTAASLELTTATDDGVAAGESATLVATLRTGAPVEGGEIRIRDIQTNAVLATGPANGSVTVLSAVLPSTSEGTHAYRAEFDPPSAAVQSATADYDLVVVTGTRPETTMDGSNIYTTFGVAWSTFSSPDPDVSFQCRVDVSNWFGCSGPTMFQANGLSHSIVVRAVAANGLADRTPASRAWIIENTPPAATGPVPIGQAPGAAISGSKVPAAVRWTGSDAVSGIDHYAVALSTDGGPLVSVAPTVTTTSLLRHLAPGHTYRFAVRPVDRAGNLGALYLGSPFRLTGVSQANGAVRYAGTWASSTSSTWWGGTARASSQAGSTVSYTFTGRSIAWVGLKGAGRGKANVYVNGVYKATVDLFSATTKKQLVVWSANYASSATRTITIKVLGTAGRPRVDIDGFIVGS